MSCRLKFSILLFTLISACHSKPTYTVKDSGGVGRRYDGIGAISGGGATSKLLLNYPSKQRSEILDYLFLPNFGASLQIFKVEIGGDAQSTEGTEPSHMHVPWEENYQRGYEWELMVEAKRRNPSIKLCGLCWGFPGWLGEGTGSPYYNLENTAVYVRNWVLGAKKYYNLTIDYVGIWNERAYSISYIQVLRTVLDLAGLQNTKIIAGEGAGWQIAEDAVSDSSLARVVDVMSAHYPGTESSSVAVASGKALWASEDYSTTDGEVGAGCLARILNQNYVNGYMSSTIIWNLAASYYDYLPFKRDSLLNANEPWSGHYEVTPPLWITAHTTQFTEPGWDYLFHGRGVGRLAEGGSYVSLTSPDRNDLTIVVETMSHDMSVCIRPALKPYTVRTQDIGFQLGGSFAKISSMHVWKTLLSQPAPFPNATFQYCGTVNLTAGLLFVRDVDPNTVYTFTTLPRGTKGARAPPPPSASFPFPYAEDFTKAKPYSPPRYLTPQAGSFEIQPVIGGGGVALAQTVMEAPIRWCSQKAYSPIAVMGASNWSNLSLSVEFTIPAVNGTGGVFISVRTSGGGCATISSTGVFFWIFPRTQTYLVTTDYQATKVLFTGAFATRPRDRHSIQLIAKGNSVTGRLDELTLFSVNSTAKNPIPASGFVALGTHSFGQGYFFNVDISEVQ